MQLDGSSTNERNRPSEGFHAARMYSYFRFARKENGYKEMPPALRAELAARGNPAEIQPSEVRLPHQGRHDEGGE